MEVLDQLKSINNKLLVLKGLDSNYKIFGATKHQYRLNFPKTEEELKQFEKKYTIALPVGYREFLKYAGNGGAGPYYGLEPLENSLFANLDNHENNLVNPSRPFLFVESWNMSSDKIMEDEDLYFGNQWVNGLLRISNFGCGVSVNLVVNGAEYGHVWIDDRSNDGGLYPDLYFGQTGRTTFLEWYELWLNKSIALCNSLL